MILTGNSKISPIGMKVVQSFCFFAVTQVLEALRPGDRHSFVLIFSCRTVVILKMI